MDRVIVKPYSKDRFEVVEEFRYGLIKVPVGFKTNGADVPRVFWSLFPPNSPEYLSAVVLHDYMCANKRVFGYELADKLFYEVLIEIGVPKWKAKLFYFWVKWYHRLKMTGSKE